MQKQKVNIIFFSFIIITIFLLNSCASILNKKTQYIVVETEIPSAKAEFKDSIYTLPALIKVERSKENLPIKLITDTSNIDFLVKSSLSNQYKFLNYFFMYGYLIDLASPKRFSYGRVINLDTSLSNKYIIPDFAQNYKTKKGQIFLSFSVPTINNFYVNQENKTHVSSTGILGLSSGIDYYRSESNFITFDINYLTDFPINIEVGHISINSVYTSIYSNKTIKKITIGAGLSYSYNMLIQYCIDTTYSEGNDYTYEYIGDNQAFGFIFSSDYKFGRYFSIGIKYRSDFFRVQPKTEFKYGHVISFNLSWKMRIKE